MPASRHTTVACAVAAVLATALTACGNSTDGTAQSPGSSSPTSSGSSASSATASNASSASSAAASLTALLIAPTDVGTGFATKPSDTSDTPLPCTPTLTPFSERFPPTGKTQRDFANSGDTVEVTQAIEQYSDAATFAKLIADTEKGFGCSTGKVGNTAVRIVPAKTGTIAGLDVLKRWDAAIPSQGLLLTIVLIAKNTTAEVVSFAANKSAANSINIGLANEAAVKKLVSGAP